VQGVFTVWVITFQVAWAAVAIGGVLLALAILASVPGWSERLPPTRAFVLILLSPLAVVVWGGANWATEERLAHEAIHWRSDVLLGLAIAVLGIAIVTPIRFRRSPRWWVLIPCSLIAVIYTAAALFVGGMAIVNDWL
jgi:hypothetical protein